MPSQLDGWLLLPTVATRVRCWESDGEVAAVPDGLAVQDPRCCGGVASCRSRCQIDHSLRPHIGMCGSLCAAHSSLDNERDRVGIRYPCLIVQVSLVFFRAGTSLRSAADVDVPGLLAGLAKQVEEDSGLPLLRIHWYDSGTRQGAPSGNQRDIATLPKVKLRLGRVGFSGEQKGVDLKLALDLITQSRNKAAESRVPGVW